MSNQSKASVKQLLFRYRRVLMIFAVVAVMGALKPNLFFTSSFLTNLMLSVSIYGIMMCGTIFVLIYGGVDLSIAVTAAMSGSVLVKTIIDGGYTTGSVVKGVILALLVGQLIGVVNGFIITRTGMPPMVATLASKYIVNAVNKLYIGSLTVSLTKPDAFTWIGGGKLLGIPMPIVFFVVFVALSYVGLEKTVFGRKVYAVGGNKKASDFTGIHVKNVGMTCFMISAFTASVAGIVLASFNKQAVYFAAQGYETNVLVALIVGGVRHGGGEGRISGAVFGALLFGILNRSLILLGVDSVYHDFVRGALILAVVASEAYTQTARSGLNKKGRKSRRLKSGEQPR